MIIGQLCEVCLIRSTFFCFLVLLRTLKTMIGVKQLRSFGPARYIVEYHNFFYCSDTLLRQAVHVMYALLFYHDNILIDLES